MSSLSISMVIASIAVLIVLMMSFGYIYISERKSYILLWFISLGSILLSYASRLVMSDGREETFPLIINTASLICGYWLLFKGTSLFFGKRTSPLFDIAASLLILAYIAVKLLNGNPNPVLAASCAYSAATLAVAGHTCISARHLKNPIKKVTGTAFYLWAVSTLIYPFTKILTILPLSLGYTLLGLAGLVTYISIQAAYFYSVREEMQSNENQIRKLAQYDKLTGVFNRAYFEEISDVFFDRFQLPAVLAMGDVNGLKLINDTFGHKKGDELLISAVGIMKGSVGDQNVLVRWGGDEFIIIMPRTNMDQARQTIENIRTSCRSFHSNTIPIDISIGLSAVESREQSIEAILSQAEEKMYSSKLHESKQTRKAIMDFLQKLLWEKDYHTEEHGMRLQGLAFRIGKHIGLSAKENGELVQAALLHDIGKIAVPEAILNKPGPLTREEWEVMKRHSEAGYRIAQSSREFAHISEAILGHHEWWNGSGYPQGLKGKDIPLYSRIISIVDSFDVMTHDRPYKKAISTADALMEIKRCAGNQYDPYLTEVFADILREFQTPPSEEPLFQGGLREVSVP